ncbi:MAG: hypothetical protein H7Y88_12860 [Phycisphaerales bacterium]|nr:hypothetical protein [Phycisphaerales bacterium]
MNWTIVIIVVLVVLVLGSLAAVAWWNLVNRVVPYADQRKVSDGKRAGVREREEVVVIRDERGEAL